MKKSIIYTIVMAFIEYCIIYNMIEQKKFSFIIFALIVACCYALLMYLNINKIKMAKANKSTNKDNAISDGDIFSDNVNLVGVTFNSTIEPSINRQDLISKLEEGDDLTVKKYEYEGKPAIMLLNKDGIDVGNLPAATAKKYYNCNIEAEVEAVIGGYDNKSYGCSVDLTIEK